VTYEMYFGGAGGRIGKVDRLRAEPTATGTDFIGEVMITSPVTLHFLELHDGDTCIRSDYFTPTTMVNGTTIQLTLQVKHPPGGIDLSQFNRPLPKPPAFASVDEADAWLEGQR
jgi:hypothetical protein